MLNGQRFLIAEDEVLIAMLLDDVVTRLGGVVAATARVCDSALAAVEAGGIDAVILDVHLHGGTSETVLAAAMARNVPVLVCTGSDTDALPSAFRNLPLLKKPWQDEEAESALEQLFEKPESTHGD